MSNGPRRAVSVTAAGSGIGRLSEPGEIADVAFWRCSDQASYVAGQAIAVDGGYTST